MSQGARERWGRGMTREALTGTFFWMMTTAVSLPRTAIDVCPEPEIALKAYSGTGEYERAILISSGIRAHPLGRGDPRARRRSDIYQTLE